MRAGVWLLPPARTRESDIDAQGDDRVHRDARYDNDHPAVQGLERETGRPVQAISVGARHAHDPHETAQRNESQLVSRLSETEAEEARAESDGERGDGHAGPLGGQQVPELMEENEPVGNQYQE